MYNQNGGVKQMIKDLINFGLPNYKRTDSNPFIANNYHVIATLQELDTTKEVMISRLGAHLLRFLELITVLIYMRYRLDLNTTI